MRISYMLDFRLLSGYKPQPDPSSRGFARCRADQTRRDNWLNA
jgi:hypothetical protein